MVAVLSRARLEGPAPGQRRASSGGEGFAALRFSRDVTAAGLRRHPAAVPDTWGGCARNGKLAPC